MPKGLTHLKLSFYLHNVDFDKLPPNLTHLCFGIYNNKVNNLPNSITHLCIPPDRFINNNIKYPSNLKELYIPTSKVVVDLVNLPNTIEKIVISHTLVKNPKVNLINGKNCPLLKGNIQFKKDGAYIMNDFIKLFMIE